MKETSQTDQVDSNLRADDVCYSSPKMRANLSLLCGGEASFEIVCEMLEESVERDKHLLDDEALHLISLVHPGFLKFRHFLHEKTQESQRLKKSSNEELYKSASLCTSTWGPSAEDDKRGRKEVFTENFAYKARKLGNFDVFQQEEGKHPQTAKNEEKTDFFRKSKNRMESVNEGVETGRNLPKSETYGVCREVDEKDAGDKAEKKCESSVEDEGRKAAENSVNGAEDEGGRKAAKDLVRDTLISYESRVQVDSNFMRLHEESTYFYRLCWERLHTGHWMKVLEIWRILYSYAAYILSFLSAYSYLLAEHAVEDTLEDAFYFADIGLIMGGGESCIAPVLFDILRILNSYKNPTKREQKGSKKRSSSPLEEKLTITLTNSVKVENSALSYVDFQANYFEKRLPVLIKGALDGSPALSKWKDFSFFKELAGNRTVPVEIGSSYVEDDWTQKLMNIRSFIEEYIESEHPPAKAYLAQHPIFEQIPELSKDIITPDFVYACKNDEEEEEKEIMRMLWLGPKNTLSPLHTDPYDNVFCQVVGTKYVRMYSPHCNDAMYPFREGLLKNTSQVKYDLTLLESSNKETKHRHNTHTKEDLHKMHTENEEAGKLGVEAGEAHQNTHAHDEEAEKVAFEAEKEYLHDTPTRELHNTHTHNEDTALRRKLQENFPKFLRAPFQEALVEAGDCLFIPKGWWHFVKALTSSASVSFWF